MQKYLLIFSRSNLFRYSFVTFLSCRIYSDIHLSNIYGKEYIQIFIRQKNYIRPTLVPSLSDIFTRTCDIFRRPPDTFPLQIWTFCCKDLMMTMTKAMIVTITMTMTMTMTMIKTMTMIMMMMMMNQMGWPYDSFDCLLLHVSSE